MNTNSQTKITPQGLQMTCLGIPSENGCFFVTIFLGPQGPKQKLWQRLLNTDWFYLHASPSIVTLFQLLSSHPLGLLFQKHAQSTLWKAQVNSMRLPLLQGVLSKIMCQRPSQVTQTIQFSNHHFSWS